MGERIILLNPGKTDDYPDTYSHPSYIPRDLFDNILTYVNTEVRPVSISDIHRYLKTEIKLNITPSRLAGFCEAMHVVRKLVLVRIGANSILVTTCEKMERDRERLRR